MRTKQMTLVVVAGAVLFGFFFRLGEHCAMALPVACTTWACKDTYGWWPDNAVASSFTAEKAGTTNNPPQGTDHTTFAVLNFYTPASPGKAPANPAPNFDKYTWSGNTPDCKMVGGQWPEPQTSSPAGKVIVIESNRPGLVCTY